MSKSHAGWPALPDTSSVWAAALAGLSGAVLLALLSRTMLNHQPLYDELLHVLSARGLIESGMPAIADGLYNRALLFTHLVALSLQSFGDTLVAARLPSLFAAMLLVAAVGFWLTRRLGLMAGLTAAVLLCLMPETIRLAVFVRFYTLHALVILLLGILAFESLQPRISRAQRAAMVIPALLLLPLGWHLQPSTAIAVVAIAAGVAAVLVLDNWAWVSTFVRRRPVLCAAGFVVFVAVGLLLVNQLGLYAMLREVPMWAAWAADKPQYYLQRLAAELPLLWPLFPVAALLAWRFGRRLALFCLVVVGVGFIVHSIAAAKEMRYVYYLLPFMCVILGMAAARIASLAQAPRPALAMTALLAAMLALSAEGQDGAKLLLGKAKVIDVLPYTVEPDWEPLANEMRVAAQSADRIVTSNAMKSMYYLGRYDYELNVSIVAETDTKSDFGRDERTGRQAIGSVAAVESLLDQPGVTLLVLEEETLNADTGVPAAVVAVIQARCERLVTGSSVAVQLWRCD